MSRVSWDYSSSKQKAKQYKLKTSPKSEPDLKLKTWPEIKILANPG